MISGGEVPVKWFGFRFESQSYRPKVGVADQKSELQLGSQNLNRIVKKGAPNGVYVLLQKTPLKPSWIHLNNNNKNNSQAEPPTKKKQETLRPFEKTNTNTKEKRIKNKKEAILGEVASKNLKQNRKRVRWGGSLNLPTPPWKTNKTTKEKEDKEQKGGNIRWGCQQEFKTKQEKG